MIEAYALKAFLLGFLFSQSETLKMESNSLLTFKAITKLENILLLIFLSFIFKK